MIKLNAADWFEQNHTHLWAWFCEYAPVVSPVNFAAWCMKRYDKYLED